VHEKEAWRKFIVDAKYSTDGAEWCSLDPLGSQGVGL
jgi:hypothetical protein